MSHELDVIIVPDFRAAQSHRFEARTLYFLASWAAHAGAARRFPVHIAAIGPPPASVRRFAADLGAAISVHEPLAADQRGAANKLRGLEVPLRGERGLLLDADILVLGDFSSLATLGSCIAAAPAGKPRISDSLWKLIYSELALEPPTQRIASLCGELECLPLKGLRRGLVRHELSHMLPYHNTGVIYFPASCDLRTIWESHIRRIAALNRAAVEQHKAIACSDQAGFATACELLKKNGVPFRRLPDVFNVRPIHLVHKAIASNDIRLLHATGLCKRLPPGDQSIAREPRRYRRRILKLMLKAMPPGFDSSDDTEPYRTAAQDAADFVFELLHDLYVNHVARAVTAPITG